jgi:TPR repeat protein
VRAGQGVERDYKAASELYLQAMETGDADACGRLGLLYARGRIGGEDQELNDRKALELYKRAAEMDDRWALEQLCTFYEKGRGVDSSVSLSERMEAAGGSVDGRQRPDRRGHRFGMAFFASMAPACRWIPCKPTSGIGWPLWMAKMRRRSTISD